MLVAQRLTQNMEINIEQAMIKLGGKKTEFQSVLAKAVSTAVIMHVQTGISAPGIPFFTYTGVPGIGLSVDGGAIAQTAYDYFNFNYEKPTEVYYQYVLAIGNAISDELKLATITSISGFGGQPGKLKGLDETLLYTLIQTNLPPSAQGTEGGDRIYKSLAHAIVSTIEGSGQLGKLIGLPTVPPVLGPPIATVS